MECNTDITKTILELMNITPTNEKTVVKREPTVFDQIRVILNEKDAIYHDVMNKQRVNSA
jgi:hypothetical protein